MVLGKRMSLRKEVATLRAAVDEVKDQLLEREDSKLNLIRGNNSKPKFYTGLPSFAVFMALFTFLESKMGEVSVWSENSKHVELLPCTYMWNGQLVGLRVI